MSSRNFFQRSNKINLSKSEDMDEILYNHGKTINYNFTRMKFSYFFQIFYIALFFGLPFYPRAISEKTSDISLGIKLWCFFWCIAKLFFAVLFLFTGAIYIPHKLSIFTMYSLCCISTILTFYIVRYRKKITLSIRRLCEVSHAISPKRKTGSKHCLLQIMWFVLIFVYTAFIFIKSVYSLQYTAKYEAFGIDFLDIYRISVTFMFLNSIVITGISIIMCHNIFNTLHNTLIAYKTRLRERYKIGNYCRINILEDINMFRRILTAYEQLEDSFSPILLSINVTCIVSFLNYLSILLTRRLPLTAMIGVLTSFGQTLLAFVFLIFSAARVIKEYESLQQCLVRCSEDIAMTSPPDIPLFTVLADNIRSTKFHFSAGDMYIIDKGLIITVGGGMVTYGVIEYQLAHSI